MSGMHPFFASKPKAPKAVEEATPQEEEPISEKKVRRKKKVPRFLCSG
jgi:hypothetical protein